MAEALGSTGTAQVLDLFPNSASPYTPGYAIYENGALARLALFNYMTDPTGANDYTATITVPNAPSSVTVKYLLSDSVSTKGNMTWAGQTFGGYFASDGRLTGTEVVQTVTCSGGECAVKVPAPGMALVFVDGEADFAFAGGDTAQVTFATTTETRTVNTIKADPTSVASSNGQRPFDGYLSSSPQKKSEAEGRRGKGRSVMVGMVVAGVVASILS